MKNSYKFIIAILLFIAFVLLHDSVEKNSLQIGLSWTLSTLVPYILVLIASFLVGYQLTSLFKDRSRSLSRFIFLFTFLAFFGIAFWAHPIYEDDFSNNMNQVVLDSNEGPVFDEGLTMVALPGCPFCFARIPLLNELKTRNPQLNITVLLVKESEETAEIYNKELVGTINVEVTKFGSLIAQNTKGRFPAFFYRTEKDEIMYWDQRDFGNLAFDWIEGRY
jgi:thiol-disulfide isomerase/thioredoxin